MPKIAPQFGLEKHSCEINSKQPSSARIRLPGYCAFWVLIICLFFSGCQKGPAQTAEPSLTATQTAAQISTSSSAAATLATTSATTAAPTKPAPTPVLPMDPLVEKYFGPLPEPKAIKTFTHQPVRALYTGAAGNFDANLSIASQTEINTLIVDLKESDGIRFDCSVPLAKSIGAVRPAYDLHAVVDQCHQAGVRVIGRIVCFKDPKLAKARPEYCIKDQAGKVLVFSNEGGEPFVSPYNQDVWQYNIDIALNALEFGVDEIQFDYVRFPTGGAKGGTKPYFGPKDQVPSRVLAINRFLQTAKILIQDECGVPLGADVFGIIINSAADGQTIGQDWQTIGLTGIDSVSPMIYPSHYANSSTGHYTGNGKGTFINGVLYPKPDLEPYDVMFNVLKLGQAATGQPFYATNRPWLQAFTASYLPEGYYQSYGKEEIRAQIKAIEDAGYQEWICWNASGQYSRSAFEAKD